MKTYNISIMSWEQELEVKATIKAIDMLTAIEEVLDKYNFIKSQVHKVEVIEV